MMFESVLDWLRTKRDPLRGENSAARWAATVTSRDTADIQRKVVETLGSFPTQRKRVLPEHFDALVKVDQRVDPVVTELEGDFVSGFAASAEEESRLWRAVFELVRVLLAAYVHTLRFAGHSADRRWSTRLPLLLVRLAHFKAQDARLRLYRYARWSAAQWREMHQIYELARARRWHHRRLAFGEGDGARELPSVEELYVRTLFEQRMDSGSFTPDQVAWVAERLQTWASGIRLESRRNGQSTFFVDPAGSTGLRRVSGPIPMSRVFYAATQAVLQRIEERLRALDSIAGAAPGPDSGELPVAEERLVLHRLHGLFVGEGAATVARAERQPTEQPVRVVVGLAAIAGALGRVPGDGERGPLLPAPGIWRIADRSRSGLRLLAPEQSPARIGNLVGIELGGAWQVGVVRRMVRLETDEVTYGVEILGHRVVAVEVAPVPEKPAAEPALYLPAAPENREPSLKSIIVRDALACPQEAMTLHHGGVGYLIRLGARIDGSGNWAYAAIDSAQEL